MPETNSATTPSAASKHKTVHRESDRNVLIYTGYILSALLLLGAVAYHFSQQLIR
jgi:hypothetical protein